MDIARSKITTRTERKYRALLECAKKNRSPSIPTRLWVAAQQHLPDTVGAVLPEVAKAIRTKGLSWDHIFEVWRILDRETDALADRALGGDLDFPRWTQLIDREARFAGSTTAAVSWKWIADSEAFIKLIETLAPRIRRPRTDRKIALLGICLLCWRTAPLTTRGRRYCPTHKPAPSNDAYKRARELLKWCPPNEDSQDSQGVYLIRKFNELKRAFPTSIFDSSYYLSIEILHEIYEGKRRDCRNLPSFRIDLTRAWEIFPHTMRYLDDLRPRINPLDAASVVKGLDPPGKVQRILHAVVHSAYIRDQRLLLGMLETAEAWLHTAQYRSQFHGGARMRNAGFS